MIQRPGTPPKYSEGAPVRHDPVTRALVGNRLDVGQVRMRQHGDEDLDILLAAAGAQTQRLAGEVGQAVKPRLVVEAHLRRHGPAPQTLAEQRAEPAVGIGLAPLGQGFVAVLDPELAPRQPGAPALAGRGERFDDRIPGRAAPGRRPDPTPGRAGA